MDEKQRELIYGHVDPAELARISAVARYKFTPPPPAPLKVFADPEHGRRMTDPAEIRRFITAGNAVFTLKSLLTGKHYTYKIANTKNDVGTRWFVSVSTDYMEFLYMGLLKTSANGWLEAQSTAKSPRGLLEFQNWLGFQWFLKMLNNGIPLVKTVQFWHMGHCGRCNRPLTDPLSIERGIGPDCWEMMNDAA